MSDQPELNMLAFEEASHVRDTAQAHESRVSEAFLPATRELETLQEFDNLLYAKFAYRRRVQGFFVDSYWLQSAFLMQLVGKHPDQVSARMLRMSRSWVSKFCQRYEITYVVSVRGSLNE